MSTKATLKKALYSIGVTRIGDKCLSACSIVEINHEYDRQVEQGNLSADAWKAWY